VIYLCAHGYSLAEIGRLLHLSVDAIKSRLKKAGRTLGLERATQAALVAHCLRNGYIDTPPSIPKFTSNIVLNPEQMATIFYLSYGMSQAEIGVQMSVPENTVKSRVEWAARNLRVSNNSSLLVAIAFHNGWLE